MYQCEKVVAVISSNILHRITFNRIDTPFIIFTNLLNMWWLTYVQYTTQGHSDGKIKIHIILLEFAFEYINKAVDTNLHKGR